MVAGDALSSVGASNTAFTFESAAGVEVCITSIQIYNAICGQINIGTGVKSTYYDGATSTAAGVTFNGKMMIINGFGLFCDAGSAPYGGCYSGIQIK
jgi:hypothetical protein